ncbi:ABC transporter ATP-binding protein [Paenibacillus sp. 1P07SE]|uniref:ABC transporter ATP-binding protein n=1 Tax=Paenibacillus sp. 1P07SE TaxID=3132209 RepID=UPI0039A5BB04
MSKTFHRRRRWPPLRQAHGGVPAVQDVSLRIEEGENVALVGESGSGKSTLARLLLGLEKPDSGHVRYRGVDYTDWRLTRMRPIRSKLQIVFQNSLASFNPLFTVEQIVGEPLRNYKTGDTELQRQRIADTLELVGLGRTYLYRYPHELSGGQQQRVGIARAVALRPELIICDESFASLDATLRRQMIDLLQELKQQLGLAYLFITHDLRLVQRLCDSVNVMAQGRIVEHQSGGRLLEEPAHPYTRKLMASLPIQHPRQRDIRDSQQACNYHPTTRE